METGRSKRSRPELLPPSSGYASSVAGAAGLCVEQVSSVTVSVKACGLITEPELKLVVAVVLKSSQEIEKMRRAGQVVREVLELVRSKVKPGATTSILRKPPKRG